MKKIFIILVVGFLLLLGSEAGAQFATPLDSTDVAGWKFTTFTDVDDSLTDGHQIYEKIDSTTAKIPTAEEADSALAFTHQGIKKFHADSTSESFVFSDVFRITSADPESMFMSRQYIDDAAGGLVAQSVKGDHVDSTSEDFVFDGAYHKTSEEADSAYLTHGGAAATYLTGNESMTLSGDATGSGATAITVTVVDDLHDHVYSNIDETTSANWIGRVSDETGTGAWVFGTSPTFTTDITSPLVIGGTATTADLSLKTTSGVGATGADMHFLVGNNGATEAVTILNNGYVGIGINSPSSILHVKASVPGVIGSHSAGQLIIQNPTNSVYANAVITGYESDGDGNPDQQLWYLGGSSGSSSDVTLLNRRNSKLHLGANGATKMTILGDGNVGIGTLNPPERLSVVGNIATGDSTTGDVDVFHYFSTDASWTTEYLKWDDGNGRFEFSDDLYLGGTVTSSDTLTKSFVIQAPDTDHDLPLWMTPKAITLIACSGVAVSGTNVVGCLMEYDNDAANPAVCNSSDWTFTTGEERTTSLSNASIDAGDYLGWKTTSVSGEVSFVTITFEYTQP